MQRSPSLLGNFENETTVNEIPFAYHNQNLNNPDKLDILSKPCEFENFFTNSMNKERTWGTNLIEKSIDPNEFMIEITPFENLKPFVSPSSQIIQNTNSRSSSSRILPHTNLNASNSANSQITSGNITNLKPFITSNSKPNQTTNSHVTSDKQTTNTTKSSSKVIILDSDSDSNEIAALSLCLRIAKFLK